MDNSKKKFIESMEYLAKYYINFKADFNDPVVQRIWFNSLKQINPNDIEFVVVDYCRKNVYPPQSPTHLLEHYNKLFELRVIDIVSEAKYLVDRNLKLIEVEIPFSGLEKKYIPDYDAAIAAATGTTKDVLTVVKNGLIKLDKNDVYRYLSRISSQKILLKESL